MKMSYWRVAASYPAALWPEFDAVVEKAAGREPSDSGMGFGERDLGWVVDTQEEARLIDAALQGLKGVKVTVRPIYR